MSGIKRKREKTAQIQKDLEAVYKDGFHRVIIRSEKSGRFIGVYYVSPDGEYLKNTADILNWIDSKILIGYKTNLVKSNFTFIAKKLTDFQDEEYIIDQNNLPPELVDFILEKKKSIAPGIITIEQEISSENDFTKYETIEKKIKLEELSENDVENKIDSNVPTKKEIPLEDLVLRPQEAFEFPLVSINKQHALENVQSCHVSRLMNFKHGDALKSVKKFKTYCSMNCAFDIDGLPRIAFECDICLALWHTDCTGYRWLVIDGIKLILCDNCDILRRSIKIQVPNTFCDVDYVYNQEYEKSPKQSENVVPPKLVAMSKLCKVQWILTNFANSNNKTNLIKIGQANKILPPSKPLTWRHDYEVMVTAENFIHERQDNYIRINYNIQSIDQLIKIFADNDCQLLIDDESVAIFISRIVLNKGEMFIPIKPRLTKPCKAIFYTMERGQDQNIDYKNRMEELRAKMMSSFYSRFEAIEKKSVPVVKEIPPRAIPLTPVISPANCFKIISSNRVFLQKPNIRNSQTISTTAIANLGNHAKIVKLRQRKQDFTNKKSQWRIQAYMKNIQFNLLNLPFLVLERILSSPNLSTQDKLNCRLTSRVLKCVIDGGQVWSKLVINPGFVTGLDNMLTFFRTKVVKKITFCIDFQESFGMEFLLSFISRLKMFPEYMHLEKFSIKFMGSVMQSSSQLSIQDILSSFKSLKNLSISCENIVTLLVPRKQLASHSIEKLKLKNIQNIYEIVKSNGDNTPNLRALSCGDWSHAKEIDNLSLNHITCLEMYFSDSVNIRNISALSTLSNLEKLSISRPLVSEELINFMIETVKPPKISWFYLNSLAPTQDCYAICYKLACCFPKNIVEIVWKFNFDNRITVGIESIDQLKRNLLDILPKNVKLIF